MLLGIPDESTNFLSPPVRSDHVHAFTDGSCLDPTSDLTRLASWGVTIGSPQDEQFWPLANGLLPGYWQSTLRAETTAAIAACEFALSCNISITLWVDNDQVYKKVKRFQQGGVGLPVINVTPTCGVDYKSWFRDLASDCTM
jgi:ribonuclease HI